MSKWCNYCDPKHFVIYGFCKNCNRKCEPPLFDSKGNMSLLDYEQYKNKWNEGRTDFISDQFRRRADEKVASDNDFNM